MSFPHRIGPAVACLVALATLLPAATEAYFVEVRGTDVEVPIRYADGDDTSPATVDVTYRLNEPTFPTGPGVADAVRASFASWTAAGCSNLVLTEGAPSDSTDRAHWMGDDIAGGEIYIVVYFTDSAEEWSGPSVGHFYFAHDGTGTLIGGTVVLNSRDHSWATDEAGASLDVQSVVTALIGRALGLTSEMEMNATFPRYAPGDITKRMLGDDDLAGIAFLYPSGEVGCDAITAPQDECNGTTLPGADPCPPRPETTPGDGGTLPGADAGVMMGSDSGVLPTADAGTGMDMGDGCSCRAGGAPSSRRGVAWLGTLALGLLFWRRRR